MHRLRIALLSLALGALAVPGCVLTQANILAHYDLPNPFQIGPAPAQPFLVEHVDLNTISEYSDHKDELESLSDVALIGTFTNVTPPGPLNTGGTLELWITPGTTNLPDAGAIQSSGTKLWGPGSIGPSGTASGTVTIGWDESAALFSQAGKDMLIDIVKGDGVFTAYIISSGATSQTFRVDDGAILLVLSGGI
jgi:hypothetical protein